MRQKIARAIAAQYWDRLFQADAAMARMTYPAGKDAYLDERWELYLPNADAVLDALMEPTEEMVEAGEGHREGYGHVEGLHPHATDAIFIAMIRAAKEGK